MGRSRSRPLQRAQQHPRCGHSGLLTRFFRFREGLQWRRRPVLDDMDGNSFEYPDYGSISYWDKRYAGKDGLRVAEWLLPYSALREVVLPLLPSTEAEILVVGCGTSTLGEEIYDDGFKCEYTRFAAPISSVPTLLRSLSPSPGRVARPSDVTAGGRLIGGLLTTPTPRQT